MESTIQIIQLPPERWEEYKAIRLESMQVDPQAFGDKYEEWVAYPDEKWQKRPNDPDTIIMMAEDEGKFIGIVAVHINHTEDNNSEAHIWGMYISPSYRGRGVGKLLMQGLLNKIEKIPGIHRVELMVNTDQAAAVKLYTALGFNDVGQADWELGDHQTHRLAIMEKAL